MKKQKPKKKKQSEVEISAEHEVSLTIKIPKKVCKQLGIKFEKVNIIGKQNKK